jgi:hypothetical protein
VGTCAHCDRPTVAKGLCNAHRKKLMKYGDPLAGTTNMRGRTRLEQYLAKFDQHGPDECWPWTAGRSEKNYGQFADGDGGSMPAHRFGFTAFIRPLEHGEVVDHTCHNRDDSCPGGDTCEHRACQNPAHWEAVDDDTNMERGKSFSAVNGRKTHCDSGHELTPENSYGYKGRRQCKTCARDAARERNASESVKAQLRERYQRARDAGLNVADARLWSRRRDAPPDPAASSATETLTPAAAAVLGR